MEIVVAKAASATAYMEFFRQNLISARCLRTNFKGIMTDRAVG